MPAVTSRAPRLVTTSGTTFRASTRRQPLKGATLRADMAAELNRLETQAAVLERDARNARSILVERGLDLVPDQPRRFAWEAARSRWMRSAAKAWRASTEWTTWAARTWTPYIATGFRLAKRGAVEGALYCTFAGVTIAVFTLAIVVLAPPD
jgi:hypothetical protein